MKKTTLLATATCLGFLLGAQTEPKQEVKTDTSKTKMVKKEEVKTDTTKTKEVKKEAPKN